MVAFIPVCKIEAMVELSDIMRESASRRVTTVMFVNGPQITLMIGMN